MSPLHFYSSGKPCVAFWCNLFPSAEDKSMTLWNLLTWIAVVAIVTATTIGFSSFMVMLVTVSDSSLGSGSADCSMLMPKAINSLLDIQGKIALLIYHYLELDSWAHNQFNS